jgi:hypothetical protein
MPDPHPDNNHETPTPPSSSAPHLYTTMLVRSVACTNWEMMSDTPTICSSRGQAQQGGHSQQEQP